MADNSPFALPGSLIAGRFAVDTAQQLLDAGGGVPAYLARDRVAADGRRVALSVSRDASPRSRHLKLLNEPIDNLMMPLGHGVAPAPGGTSDGYFVICTFPPGPPLSASLTSWPEKAVIDLALKPIAEVLHVLHGRKLTHRAIRLNNIFQAAPGQPVTLGAAWAAPPAMHQPAVFESPYNAMCHPAGRGDGTIADDVYALGVVMLALVTGRVPMARLDDDTIVRWKLDLGNFAALTRDAPVSGSFADLLHVMLAEDPDHRPLPAQLLDHTNLRGRRVGVRPPRRSARALMLNEIPVFDAQTLAYALLGDEKKAIQLLRNGQVTQWLRRGLGDGAMAVQIEDRVRFHIGETKLGPRRDPFLVMEIISTINPRMPLCWRGVALWPDALPDLLAQGLATSNDLTQVVEELLVDDLAATWSTAEARRERPLPPDLPQHRAILQAGGQGALLRLFYMFNPLLPCRAPATSAKWIASMADLMSMLDHLAQSAGDSLIDHHLAAFIAARGDRRAETQINTLQATESGEAFRLNELALLQELQTRHHPAPMPGLAKWVAGRLRPDLLRWRNKLRREAMQSELDTLAKAGLIARLLDLVHNRSARALDALGAQRAAQELTRIDAAMAAIDTEDKLRFANAEQFGQAIAGGIGLSVFILTLMSALLR